MDALDGSPCIATGGATTGPFLAAEPGIGGLGRPGKLLTLSPPTALYSTWLTVAEYPHLGTVNLLNRYQMFPNSYFGS
jgi:hypothetical protein